MAEQRVQRKLAAILAADVVGYSRLMEADEETTLSRFKALRSELIDPKVAEYGGSIFKTTGDGILAEFPSAVDAVRYAVEVQRAMAAHNADIPEDSRIAFRMGISLGDVMVDGDDLFGNGVNVAARMEGLAEPGEICVSRNVHEHIGTALDLDVEDLGDQKVKNIDQPVRCFRIHLQTPASASRSDGPPPLADRPAVAVLPFVNMGGDPEQEFFADGITEDILTELSRFRELFVISRTSAFKYKGKALSVEEVAKELGVQYVVEGSVRKAGNRVRVTVQLIDAETDRHIWAERYDRNLEDIFAIQDEIVRSVVGTLPGRVEAARRERAAHKPTDNMAAYELVLGAKLLHHRSDPESNRTALDMIARALAIDPNYAHAHAWRACIMGQAWTNGWVDDPDAAWHEVRDELRTALALDDQDSDVHRILAAVHLTQNEFDKSVIHQDRALALNPNDDLIVVQHGEILTWLGRPEEGIAWIRKAMLLNPYHPERFWNHLGRAHFVARDYPAAIEAFKKITTPGAGHHAFLAAAHAQNGDAATAAVHAARVLELEPDFSTAAYLETMHYAREEDREHHRAALIGAGLPE